MDIFEMGIVSKADLAAALRAHQAAVDATKSPQRKRAEATSADILKKERSAKKTMSQLFVHTRLS